MTGSAYGTTPSAVAILLKTVADARAAYRESGTLSAVMIMLRRRQRRGLLELIKNARFELHNNPDLIAEVIAGGAAGDEAAAWAKTADAAAAAVLKSEGFIKARQAKIVAQLDTLSELLANAARGDIEPQAMLEGVGNLLDLFLPPAADEVAESRAAALGRAVQEAKKIADDAKLTMRMRTDTPEAARTVVDRVVGGVNAALNAADRPVPAKAAVSPQPPPAAAAALPAAQKYVVIPTLAASAAPAVAAMPRITAPGSVGARGALSVLAADPVSPLLDRFLARRCAQAIGREVPLLRTNMLLAALARHNGAGAFGAVQVTCTDEAEADSRDRFTRGGVGMLLPALAGGRGSGMATCNRGGCFEPGTLAIAVEHYAVHDPLTMVLRVQSHCGVTGPAGMRRFGEFERYGCRSCACGALRAVLEDDGTVPRSAEITRTLDRQYVEAVRKAEARWHLLLMAVLQARTQLEHAMSEIRSITRPARYVLFGSVNLNGLREPVELPVIVRLVDRTTECEQSWELALPHDPGKLNFVDTGEGLIATPQETRVSE